MRRDYEDKWAEVQRVHKKEVEMELGNLKTNADAWKSERDRARADAEKAMTNCAALSREVAAAKVVAESHAMELRHESDRIRADADVKLQASSAKVSAITAEAQSLRRQLDVNAAAVRDGEVRCAQIDSAYAKAKEELRVADLRLNHAVSEQNAVNARYESLADEYDNACILNQKLQDHMAKVTSMVVEADRKATIEQPEAKTARRIKDLEDTLQFEQEQHRLLRSQNAAAAARPPTLPGTLVDLAGAALSSAGVGSPNASGAGGGPVDCPQCPVYLRKMTDLNRLVSAKETELFAEKTRCADMAAKIADQDLNLTKLHADTARDKEEIEYYEVNLLETRTKLNEVQNRLEALDDRAHATLLASGGAQASVTGANSSDQRSRAPGGGGCRLSKCSGIGRRIVIGFGSTFLLESR